MTGPEKLLVSLAIKSPGTMEAETVGTQPAPMRDQRFWWCLAETFQIDSDHAFQFSAPGRVLI